MRQEGRKEEISEDELRASGHRDSEDDRIRALESPGLGAVTLAPQFPSVFTLMKWYWPLC